MNYRCHKNVGICYGILAANILSKNTGNLANDALLLHYGIITLGSYIGSIIPDIDSPSSVVGKHFKVLSKPINFLYGHRGVTHYPFTWIVSAYLLYIAYWLVPVEVRGGLFKFFLGVFVGIASHLFIDCFNSAGVKLLAPFSHRRFKIPCKIAIKKKKGKKRRYLQYLSGENIKDEILCMQIVAISIIVIYSVL